jgi:simple sugar transport system ATP-binding protein
MVVKSAPLPGESPEGLAAAMIGPDAATASHATRRSTTTTSAAPIAVMIGGAAIRAGELVGVAAVEGNGQRELLRAVAGLESPRSGDVTVKGVVAFVPEDRTTEGLIPAMSLTENLVLGLQDDPRWARGIRLGWSAARARTAELLELFDVRARGPDAPAGTLSGGNQQKLVLARALEGAPAVLVVENPTRGLDVRATEAIHQRLRDAAASGMAVLVYSTDLDEVLELASRVLVVHRGHVTEAPRGADRKLVGEMMLGVGA